MATVLRLLPALLMALTLWSTSAPITGTANGGPESVAHPEFAVEASAV